MRCILVATLAMACDGHDGIAGTRARRLHFTPLQADFRHLFGSSLETSHRSADFASSWREEPRFSFTLVTQTTLDRAWVVPSLCARWPGPIQLVVYDQDAFASPSFDFSGGSAGGGQFDGLARLCPNVNVTQYTPTPKDVNAFPVRLYCFVF